MDDEEEIEGERKVEAHSSPSDVKRRARRTKATHHVKYLFFFLVVHIVYRPELSLLSPSRLPASQGNRRVGMPRLEICNDDERVAGFDFALRINARIGREDKQNKVRI